MKPTALLLLCLGMTFFTPAIVAQSQPSAPKATIEKSAEKSKSEDHFALVAWLVGGTWVTDVKGPDGKTTHVENRIRYAPTHQAIEFNTDFDGKPHYSGFYAWDGVRKVIGFWYVSADGELTIGTATPDPDGKTIHQDFTISHDDGSTEDYRSTILPDSDNSYIFTVFVNQDGKWTKGFQIHYTRKN